jgi:hypothetical protein
MSKLVASLRDINRAFLEDVTMLRAIEYVLIAQGTLLLTLALVYQM